MSWSAEEREPAFCAMCRRRARHIVAIPEIGPALFCDSHAQLAERAPRLRWKDILKSGNERAGDDRERQEDAAA